MTSVLPGPLFFYYAKSPVNWLHLSATRHLHGPLSATLAGWRRDVHLNDAVDQLFIDPVECIDCGACVPVCPVSAIFALDDLPEKWHSYIEKNANYVTAGKFQADTYKAA